MIIEKDLFSSALVDELRKFMREKNAFVHASVQGDASWRVGRVRHIQELFIGKLVAEKLLSCSAWIWDKLNMSYPLPSICEVQLSSYGDGEFFKAHADNGQPEVARRRLSWVSYLNAWPGPNRYTGGDLLLQENGATTVYTPADGETVFFASSTLHEITPVSALPGWDNRRFTVNGWLS